MKKLLITALSALAIPFALPTGHGVDVPIIMYHAIEQNPSNKWEITKKDMEDDLAFLRDEGYNTVFIQDLIDYVHNGVALPDKPIVLSFDDGRYPTVEILVELLEKHDAKASMAIIGLQTDKYTEIVKDTGAKLYPHMTWSDVDVALKTDRIEIQSHTFNLHGSRGAGKNKGEDVVAYKKRLLADLAKFEDRLQRNVGITARSLAYPLGVVSKESDNIIKEAGYLASLTCFERSNHIKVGDVEGLYSLGRFLRPPNVAASEFFKKIGL